MASARKIVVRDDPAPDASSVWKWLLAPTAAGKKSRDPKAPEKATEDSGDERS
jgi:hypothetical protein